MVPDKVEVVERLIAAVNQRDITGYLDCCTDDVRLWTPWAPVEGAYEGSDAIGRFFADLQDTLPDFHLTLERAEWVGPTRVLALVQASVRGRASGLPATAMRRGADPSPAGHIATASVYEFAGGKVASIRVFLDRAEALEAVGLSE